MPTVEPGSVSPHIPRRGGRKGSYPALFGCPAAAVSSPSTLEVPTPAALTKRRLSHVSEAVSRRFSSGLTNIGWRSSPVNTQEVVDEAKSLCSQYIRSRLRRTGVFSRKLGIQRLRSVVNMTVNYGHSDDAFAQLNVIGKELETMHPKLYDSVCRQVCLTFTSEEILHSTFTAVATEMFKEEITWAKIVALFAVIGGLATDCVRQGHVNYLLCLIESLGLFVDRHLATWIANQGGWHTLSTCFKPNPPKSWDFYWLVGAGVGGVFLLIWAIFCEEENSSAESNDEDSDAEENVDRHCSVHGGKSTFQDKSERKGRFMGF